jgi:hypothetical protein
MLAEDDYDYKENYKKKLKLFENYHSNKYKNKNKIKFFSIKIN